MSALGSARRAAAGAVGAATGSPPKSSSGVVLRPRAGTAIMHHGDIRHAGDKIESGERMQLVAFFYGGERRGNALPLANPGKMDPHAITAEQIIKESWPSNAKRDPDGRSIARSAKSPHRSPRVPTFAPTAAPIAVRGLADVTTASAVRNLTIKDVAMLARVA
jgi:hypothetical protein